MLLSWDRFDGTCISNTGSYSLLYSAWGEQSLSWNRTQWYLRTSAFIWVYSCREHSSENMASSTLSLSFLGLRSLAFPSPWLLLEGPGFILSRLTLISGAFSVWSTGVSEGRTISDLSSLSNVKGFAGLTVLSGLLTRRSTGSGVLFTSIKDRRTLTLSYNGMQASHIST